MKGISSVYGFIMIFLLSMASIQTWSSAVGAMESIQGASDQSAQVEQLQGIEHLALSLSGSNLTISNDGQVTSTIEFLRFVQPNSSRTLRLDAAVDVGGSLVEKVPEGYTVEAVTSLGNVFVLSGASDPLGSIWTSPAASAVSGNNQLFENPYAPGRFYLSSGARVYAFSGSGTPDWVFDAGEGSVTDVMPIADGQIYVSVGFGYPSNSGLLYELGPGGDVISTFSVRVLDSPNVDPAVPTQAVGMGQDSGDVYYDGWFYTAGGPSGSLDASDTQLAGADASSFYTYSPLGGPTYGACEPWGNEEVLDSFSPGSGYAGGVLLNWTAFAYLGPCTRYVPQLMGTSVNDGLFVALFAAPYLSDSSLQALPGYNPYVVAVSSSGQVLFDQQAPSNGYSAVATDGSNIYLSLPQADQVQVISISTQELRTYNVGIPASGLIFDYGLLFAISQNEVKVYGASMNLVKTISLAPMALSSFSNYPDFVPALQAPSFLVLNSTTYAALIQNATGYSALVLGSFS
jgi:hypothetical protein